MGWQCGWAGGAGRHASGWSCVSRQGRHLLGPQSSCEMGELFFKEFSSSKILWFSVGQKNAASEQTSEWQSGKACQRPCSNWWSVPKRTWDRICLLTARLWHPIRLWALGGRWPCLSWSRLYVPYAWHIGSRPKTFINSVNERMNRNQGLPRRGYGFLSSVAWNPTWSASLNFIPRSADAPASWKRDGQNDWENKTFLSLILMAKSGLLFHRRTRQASYFWRRHKENWMIALTVDIDESSGKSRTV